MTRNDAKKGNEIVALLDIVERNITKLEKFLEERHKSRVSGNNKLLDDHYYSLYIGEHQDNSGFSLDLSRYFGNKELLETILAALKKQKEDLEKQLNEL